MNRLTEYREDLKRYEYKEDERGYCYIGEGQIVNKLGKLEDLEEKLGCPIEVLFRALKDVFYFNNKYGILTNINHYFRALLISDKFLIQEYIDNGGGFWYKDYMYICLKDYKKTWWLKEDKSE